MQNGLLDTGPLVALLSRTDRFHERAKRLFADLKPPLITCEAVLAETCYLVGKYAGAAGEVVELGRKGFYEIGLHIEDHFTEIRALLAKYGDQKISLADACLIRLAEIRNEPNILTFDDDFRIYRWGGNRQFSIPGTTL